MALDPADAADLDAFFLKAGQFQRSTFGNMLERQKLFSVKRRRESDRIATVVTDPRTCTSVQKKISRSRPITARPTREVKSEPAIDPPLDDLELMGRVNARLIRLSFQHRQALETFYGDDGVAAETQSRKYGRLSSLFRLTKSGKTLAKREALAAGKNRFEVTPSQLVRNAVTRYEIQGGDAIANAIKHATAQALDLKAAAEEAYTNAGNEIFRERGQDPNVERRRQRRGYDAFTIKHGR